MSLLIVAVGFGRTVPVSWVWEAQRVIYAGWQEPGWPQSPRVRVPASCQGWQNH